jgi:hypothetical protein
VEVLDENILEEDNAHQHLDQKSVNSQVSFDEFTHNNSFDGRIESELQRGLNTTGRSTTGTPARPPATAELMMLDISLDRRVEVSNSVLLQWRSRNVPTIAGMAVTVSAFQDLEMLVIVVRVSFPSGGDKRSSGRGRSGVDSAELTDDEEDEGNGEGAEGDVAPPFEMTYRLTSPEIAVFGATEMLELQQQQKKVSISTNSRRADEKHPETFMWNVFSRLKVDFQVTMFCFIMETKFVLTLFCCC